MKRRSTVINSAIAVLIAFLGIAGCGNKGTEELVPFLVVQMVQNQSWFFCA